MATWHGNPKIFRMSVYLPENHGYEDYADVECGWDYQTTSDTFRPYTQILGKEKEWGDVLGNDGAKAMLYCLAEWYNNYEGKEKLDELIEEIRKGKND